MPWLIKSVPGREELPLSEHLFLVHVPRCGGTSLMRRFKLEERALESRGRTPGRILLSFFFRRYRQLERANFPVRTPENAVCAAVLLLAAGLYVEDALPSLWGVSLAVWLGIVASFVIFFTTVVCTAPVIGRFILVHRWYLWFVHYPMFRSLESIEWCTGTNKHGYLQHLTAPKLLSYGYVTREQMDRMCSLAIVRNPYSRMVSIYGYNRFGKYETFPTFVRRWKRLMRPYTEDGQKEDWYTPCHLLPMFEFTHSEGKQLVRSIVKQEELGLLRAPGGAAEAGGPGSSVRDLPDLVRDALTDMPYANERKTDREWYEHYDQETLDLTYEMYRKDFSVFGYSPTIKQRPDLDCPAVASPQLTRADDFRRDSFRGSDACIGLDLVGVRGRLLRKLHF